MGDLKGYFAKNNVDEQQLGAVPVHLITNCEKLVKPDEPKKVRGMSAEDVTRMEKEMGSMEHDFRLFQDQYGESTLHLGATQRYVRKLLDNSKAKRFWNQRHPEILEELRNSRRSTRSSVPNQIDVA